MKILCPPFFIYGLRVSLFLGGIILNYYVMCNNLKINDNDFSGPRPIDTSQLQRIPILRLGESFLLDFGLLQSTWSM